MNLEDHPRYKEYHSREHDLYNEYVKSIKAQRSLPYHEFQAFCQREFWIYKQKELELRKELGMIVE